MSDAKRCDICGSFYMLNDDKGKRPGSCGVKLHKLRLIDLENRDLFGAYDLCAECARSLMDFMKERGRSNGNDDQVRRETLGANQGEDCEAGGE